MARRLQSGGVLLFVCVLLLLACAVRTQLVNQQDAFERVQWFREEVGRKVDKIRNDVWKGLDNARHRFDDFLHDCDHDDENDDADEKDIGDEEFTELTHEDFPKYDIRIKRTQLCDPKVKQFSGYLDTSEDKHFFFWFFQSRHDPKNDPIVLWLNGGPGCSSLTGLFFELGPCMVNDEGTDTVVNPHSWNKKANIIFLDQPINVGYSYGNGVSNTPAAAVDVHAFLQIFFKQFPKYSKLPFHIAGESYAGHYIPAIAAEIHSHNKALDGTATEVDMKRIGYKVKKRAQHIRLDSVLIGNGLVDPLTQYKYYPEMACNNPYEPILDEDTCAQMESSYETCARLISSCYESPNVFTCLPASLYCNRELIGPYQQTGKNVYDVRKDCEDNNLCYKELSAIQTYLNRDDVKRELGVKEGLEYQSCNMEINFRFLMAGDWMRPYHRLVSTILDGGIRVLVYAGDADYICNYLGNSAWTLALEWKGAADFRAAKMRPWILRFSNVHAGEYRTSGNFTFLRNFEAGHMVPFDQPAASLDFFNRWIYRRKFGRWPFADSD